MPITEYGRTKKTILAHIASAKQCALEIRECQLAAELGEIADAFRKSEPPKPTLRPWTREELWEHRDCWFREKGVEVLMRATDFDLRPTGTSLLRLKNGCWYSVDVLLRQYEYLSPSGEWLKCGVSE